MLKILKQAWGLIRRSPMQSMIVITGTAVTLAFVMVVVMNYHLRVTGSGPEPDRERMMYVMPGEIHHVDNYNYQQGTGKLSYERLLGGLPGVEKATWWAMLAYLPCSMTEDDERMMLYVREAGEGWFDFFDYRILAGKPFSVEDNKGKARETMVSRSVAERLSKGRPEDLVGKEILINFNPLKVTGIFEDVSPLYQSAYGDVIVPFDYNADENRFYGLGGRRIPLLMLAPGASMDDVVTEIHRREVAFNNEGRDYVYHFNEFYNHTSYSFFRGTMINPLLVYVLLLMVLLVVPALGMAGLINTQMRSRASEIAIRKAYGATDAVIIGRLFMEALVSTFIGAVAGYLLACLAVWIGQGWMFGDIRGDMPVTAGVLLDPMLIVYVVLACLAFTSLATLIPAWMAARNNIALTLKGGDQ